MVSHNRYWKKLLFASDEMFNCNTLQEGRGKADEEKSYDVSVE